MSSIIRARLSCHGRGSMPKVLVSKEQSRTELAGRLAGVGYSAVVMGSTLSTIREVYFRARSRANLAAVRGMPVDRPVLV